MSDTSTMPMFPLGMVLLPTMVVPINVFEPRYRKMTKDCLDGDREFGVVLIERGSEVGGGDVRTDAGTVARVIAAQELPDGRWGLVADGVRRIQVLRWLEDDPYPRAEVQDWPDNEPGDHEGGKVSAELPPVVSAWRRVLALQSGLGQSELGQSELGQSELGQSGLGQSGLGQSELGQSELGQSGLGQSGLGQSGLGAPGLPADFEVSGDPSTAVWQLASLSPLGPMDRQQLLTAASAAQRLNLLAELLAGAEELIRARIEMG